MKLVKLSEIFDPKYGTNLELNRLTVIDRGTPNAVNFVSRTSKNNGVSAVVRRIKGVQPIPQNTITVAAGGSVLETFLQTKPYYSGRDLYYLMPRQEITEQELLFYCYCIRKNKFKYSYGRQANKTLHNILLPSPDEIPRWVKDVDYENILSLPKIDSSGIGNSEELSSAKYIQLKELFDPKNGIASSLVKRYKYKKYEYCIPYVRPSNNQETSIDAYVDRTEVPPQYIFPEYTLYVSTDGQGSHTYSYVSIFEFVPNSNVTVLIPKREMTLQEKIYYALAITRNRFKGSSKN